MKRYRKCIWNTYETVKNCGWIKTAPLTVGKIYEILGEEKTWNNEIGYIVTPDYTDKFKESFAKSSGEEAKYVFYKRLFSDLTAEEYKAFIRDEKINTILT